MTTRNDVLEKGMFFEVYFFEPLTNFTEADLHHVLQFFDITLDEGFESPHPRHFEDRVFKPAEDITVSEFADILQSIKLRIRGERLLKMPKEVTDQFDEDGYFGPWDDYTLEELNLLLNKLLRFHISTTQFNTLPRRIQRQFTIFTRDGKSWRFGDRRPG